MKLSIVVVNWNSGDLLSKCVASCIAVSRDIAEATRIGITVVDNGSTDTSLEGIEQLSGVRLIRNADNVGFGRACNRGFFPVDSDFVLFLNPDAMITVDSLTKPLKFMASSANVAACGIKLLDEEGNISRGCARIPRPHHFISASLGLSRLSPRWFPDHFMREWDHGQSRKVDHVIGAFLLMRSEVFAELGGFDERFFVYLEDLDLSARVQAAGRDIWYLAEASASHVGGGCSRKVKATRLFYSLRSHLVYAQKHFRPVSGFLPVLTACLLIEPVARLAWALVRANLAEAGQTLVAYARLWYALPMMFRRQRA